jgi:CubicO group peptidase (beta-lactamase class C family)
MSRRYRSPAECARFTVPYGATLPPRIADGSQPVVTIRQLLAYGHTWFVDPTRKLSVVSLTNTTLEGMMGRFPADVRNAVYGQ